MCLRLSSAERLKRWPCRITERPPALRSDQTYLSWLVNSDMLGGLGHVDASPFPAKENQRSDNHGDSPADQRHGEPIVVSILDAIDACMVAFTDASRLPN